MKPLIPVTVALSLALVSASGRATTKPSLPQPDSPRTVVVSAKAAPPVIDTALLESTLIVLPKQEKVANVYAGDTVNWVFDGGHLPSRFLSVKPRVAGAETDVHIISDHGNEYTLELREVSHEADPHFDSKVFLVPGDKAAKARLVELPVFVPASQVTALRQRLAMVKAAKAAAIKAERTKEETFRSRYPGTLRFDFAWNKSKGGVIGLHEIWHDSRFTYLRGDFEETPALYEVKAGKPSLINYTFYRGLYTVPKELDRGYLVIGKQKVEFHRTDGSR